MFWEIFIKLCAENNKKPNPVAKELGFGSSAVTYWKKGTIPNDVSLQKIANYFGVSVDYLLGKDEKEKLAQESGTISIRSRDGSVIESELSDEQLELFKNMLKQIWDKNK